MDKPTSSIKTVTCLGGGTIGASWASYFLWRGLTVRVQDITPAALARAKNLVENNLRFLVGAELLDKAAADEALKRVTYTLRIAEAVAGTDFIQESVFENYETKWAVVQEVDQFAPPGTILASSTSGLLISEIQKKSLRPDKYITAHPFNPPLLIPLVELVKGKQTSDETVSRAYAFYTAIRKQPIVAKKEVPGHIANRIAMGLWRECIDLVMNDVCSVEDVDRAVCFGPGLRLAVLGPHMIYQLGGGPGGIRGIIDAIGPSIETWWEDMATWKKFPPGCKDVLEAGVKEEMGDRTSEEIAAWRDEKLLGLLKILKALD